MSTRACYTFTDSQGEFHVYKHHDGYPYAGGVHNINSFGEAYEGGALVWINNAKKFAWDLPRFEADEFAASFVAANKQVEGGCRLINKTNPWEFSGDSQYWYKVKVAVPALDVWKEAGGLALDVWVDVYRVDWWGELAYKDKEPKNELIMSGALSELLTSERARKHAEISNEVA